ncbi:hypothetical protein C7999DRAFT_30806 [Corynascus novoguineensis]|uniref:Uncharacterized protein n=1 Tax=Corynascus novoguineensis TaxID=1126955 RepID=A0AAN7CUS3_9PEZI|nr:hypothetical protein C7999DRAFT_30806 [Corynascus novoguineensis]
MMGSRDIARSYPFFTLLHFSQFALAIAVCALYGVDIDRARKARAYPNDRWIYAEAVGGLSAVMVILYCFPSILRSAAVWMWNLVLLILWAVLFGVFAKMFINVDPRGNRDLERMKNALWVVLASTLLWFFGFFAHLIYWHNHRNYRSRFTGRAAM